MSGPNGSGPHGPSLPHGSSLPAWKQALLDRIRRPGVPEPPTVLEPTGASSVTVDSSSSTWKRTSLGKKLMEYTSSSSSYADQVVTSLPAEGETPQLRVESTWSTSGDDHLVEERLLPIKQNPILVSDRQKRNRVKGNHHPGTEGHPEKPSTSPTSSSKISGLETDGTPSPKADLGVLPAITNQQSGGDDSEGEVFDEEVIYGKGFVHKLLQKFINLSGKEEPPPPGISSSKAQGRVRSSGENRGRNTRNSSQYSNCDGEENNISKSPGYIVAESSMQNGNKTVGISSGGTLISVGSKVDREQNTNQSLINAEELPQNIVSSKRDIFGHHSGSTTRKKPGVVENLKSEQTDGVASKKRPVPSTDPASSLPGMVKADGSLNRTVVTTVSMEKPSNVEAAGKSAPRINSQKNLPMNRILYSASGGKKTNTAENPLQRTRLTTGESVTNAGEKTGITHECSVAPSGQTGKEGSFPGHSAKVMKPSAESDSTATVGKVSSLLGSQGLENPGNTDDAKHDDCERTSSHYQTDEHGARVKQVHSQPAGAAKFTQNTEAGSHVDFGSSVKKETDGALRKTTGFVDNLSSSTAVQMEPPSDSHNAVRMGLSRALHDPGRSPNNESSVDISADNAQKKEIGRRIEINNATTRIRVGGDTPSPLPLIPLPGDMTPTHLVPTISSIHTENQVTVVQIGGVPPPTMFQDKTKNEHLTRPVEGRGGKTDAPQNAHNSVINKGMGTRIAVDYYENTPDLVNTQNSSNEDGVMKKNIKNVGNTANRNDNSWDDDPSVKTLSSASNDVGRKPDSKSPGAPRPGKLLIRPASNHPASKTKSEFLTMTKFNDIKTGEFAPARRPAASKDALVNGDAVDRGSSPVEDLSGLEQVDFVGGGVSIGRSMLAKTKRGKKLRIDFDDSALQTHEYPSEQSLMAESPPEPGYCDFLEDDSDAKVDLMPSGLMASPALSAGQNFSSYSPRASVDYTFGMDRLEGLTPSDVDPEPQPLFQTSGVAPDSSDNTTFSKDFSADLLF